MSYPSKTISLAGESITVCGPSENDIYFRSIGDGLDPEFTYLLQRVLAPDDCCIDVGANIGIKAIQMARHVPLGRVLAVEAGPVIFDVLRTNVLRQGLHHLSAEHAAVCNHVGSVNFAEDSAYGHIAPSGVAVQATTLASLVERHGLTRLDFVKIDVEGFEFPILRNSAALFAVHRTTVCFEFNSWCQIAFTDERPRMCLEWLLETFPKVYILHRDRSPDDMVELLPREGALQLLVKNVFQDGHVTDLILTNGRDLFRS